MLQIDDLTIRVAPRNQLDQATAFIAEGWKVGLVGRNGAGKSTLLRLIIEEAVGGKGSIRLANRARIGHVAQEIAPSPRRLIDVVLDADTERAALLAGLETSTDPDFIAESHMRLVEIDAHSAEAREQAVDDPSSSRAQSRRSPTCTSPPCASRRAGAPRHLCRKSCRRSNECA